MRRPCCTGEEIINAVGAEVDRIETEIQRINPGVRYVDLETDRGQVTGTRRPAISGSASPACAVARAVMCCSHIVWVFDCGPDV